MNNLERIPVRIEDICGVVAGVVFHPRAGRNVGRPRSLNLVQSRYPLAIAKLVYFAEARALVAASLPAAKAAFSMRSATACGCDTYTAWLPLTSTTVEPARLDIARWAAGGIILSSVTYSVGVRNVHHERHEAVNLAWKWERYGRFIDAELLSELLLPGNRRASRCLARHHRDLGTLSPLVRELAPQHWVGDV